MYISGYPVNYLVAVTASNKTRNNCVFDFLLLL